MKAKIATFEKQYEQDADCCDPNGPSQFITIKQEDGGGGPFWIIETERWAFESIEELVKVLRDAGVPEQAEPEKVVAA